MKTVACDLCGSQESMFLLEKSGARYTQCTACKFIFTNPRSDDVSEENENDFTRSLHRYVEKGYSPKWQRIYQKKIRRFEKWRSTGQFLEIGCNVGALLHMARHSGWQVTGIEPVSACAHYGIHQHALHIIPSTLEQAGLVANTYDVVYANAVFEHLPSPRSVLREIHRVLRPGGVLFLDTVNYDSFTREFIGTGWKLIAPNGHLSLFSPATLRRFCEEAGLKVIRIKTHGVRLRPNGSEPPRGLAQLREGVRKLFYSTLTRIIPKGDSIAVWAEKRD
jgi:2-polyprenyl-3-methyl-5-hydroxy-6-metoxy-1,4-benzoquinol methylase